MNRLRTIRFVTEKSEDEIIKYIKDGNKDVGSIVEMLRESRVEYGLKVQCIIEKLQKME